MSRELKIEFYGAERSVTMRRKASQFDIKEDVVEVAFPYLKQAVAQILGFEADLAIHEAFMADPELQVIFTVGGANAWKDNVAKLQAAGRVPAHPLPPGVIGKLKMAALLNGEAARELAMVDVAADNTPETDGDRFFAGLESEQRTKDNDPTRGVV